MANIDGLAVRTDDPVVANLAIIAAELPGLRVALVAGQTEPEWQGWRSPSHDAQGTELPAPTAVYEWRVAGASRLVTLFYPTRPGESCPVVALAADADPAAAGVVVTTASGETLVLDETGYPVD